MRAKIDMDVRRGVLIHHYRYNPLFPSCMQHVSKGVLRN